MNLAEETTHLSRIHLLRIGYIASEVSMDFPSFKEMLRDWTVKPVGVNGVLVGMFANKNSEIHFSILPHHRKRWFSRGIVKEFLKPVFEVYGCLTTAVPDDKSDEVVKKFGFKEIGRIDTFTVYKLEELKW